MCAGRFKLQAGHSQPAMGMLQVAATAQCTIIIISSIINSKPASGAKQQF